MGIDPTHRVTVDAGILTDDQRDGLACVTCRTRFAPGTRSIPVAVVDGRQVFAHLTCVPPCSDCGTVQYEYTDLDNDTARMDCPRGHAFPTAEPFTDAGRQADAERRAEQDGQDEGDEGEGEGPTPDEDGQDGARARRVAENVLYLARRGPAVQQLADANRAEGRTGVADALDAVADAHDRLADAVDYGGDWIAAVGAIRDASARAAARAQEADNTPPLVTVNGAEGRSGGFLIPPPADPVMRAEWEAGAAAREAAGLSGFVGEDYPAEDGR